MYIPLHGHSTFSFLEAVAHPKHIAKKAKSLELPAIGVTDLGGMYGAITFYFAAKDEGIKPLIGVELGFVLDLKGTYLSKNIGNICLLAINDQGYYSLMKLTSFANQEGLEGKPKIDLQILKQWSEGILVFYGGIESWIGKMLNNGESADKIKEIHEMISSIFEKRCYLEITAQDEHVISEIKPINQFILTLAETTQTPLIVNNNYFYPEQKDKPVWEMALSIKDNTKMYDAHRRQPVGQYHIMTEEEIREICLKNEYKEEQISERLKNNEKIAEQVDMKIKLGQTLFPVYEAPEEIKELYEKYKDEMIVE
ncbi:MAG: PHP domain-containing protein [Candidatus Peribacteria bacterium]|jgi:DNA polymerase-3 subunit alpha|nr:PHP domain-containing protein [Candidatus Peribacteria bacterium]